MATIEVNHIIMYTNMGFVDTTLTFFCVARGAGASVGAIAGGVIGALIGVFVLAIIIVMVIIFALSRARRSEGGNFGGNTDLTVTIPYSYTIHHIPCMHAVCWNVYSSMLLELIMNYTRADLLSGSTYIISLCT